MPTDPSDADPLALPPLRERRAARGAAGSRRWVREILGRPLRLERRGPQLHVVLVERRRKPEQIRADALVRLREELALRLLELDSQAGRHAMRHLNSVYEHLGKRGWDGLGALPSRVLGKAAVQAQMLSARDASRRMQAFIEHLLRLQVAAEVREDRARFAPPEVASDAGVDVVESTPEAFRASQESWVGTVVPDPDPTR